MKDERKEIEKKRDEGRISKNLEQNGKFEEIKMSRPVDLSKNSSLGNEDPVRRLREEFLYEFDSDLKLKNIKTGKGFSFTTQEDYTRIGKLVQKVVQHKMVELGLIKTLIPIESTYRDSSKSYIYTTPNILTVPRPKVLLLIQGAGAVRPGLWARSVSINSSLTTGSMLPFINFAQTNNMDLIIFNPNKNKSNQVPIPLNTSLSDHSKYVWSRFISKESIKEIFIVAHSCGGITTMVLINEFWDEFKEKVKGIAFTDTVHGYEGVSKEKLEFLRTRAVDWVASSKELNAICEKEPVVKVSAGDRRHEYTTGTAQKEIEKFLLSVKNGNAFLSKNEKSRCTIV